MTSVCGQQNKGDSLKTELSIASEGHKIGILLQLSQYFINVNVDTAMAYGERAMHLAEESKIPIDLARANSQLARIKLITAAYDDALDHLLKAENILMEQDPVDRNELLRVYSNLGSIYERQDELKKSLPYFERAIALLDQLDREANAKTPSPLHAPLLNNMANTLIKMGDTAKAILCHKKGLQYAMAAHDYFHAGNLLNNLGKLYLEQNKIAEAYLHLHQGRVLRKQNQDDRGLASSCRNLALYFMKQQNADSAKHYIAQSIKLYNQIGEMTEPLSGVYMILSEVYLTEKKYDSALISYKLHVVYKDSIYSGDKFKDIARVEAKYEMIKKAQQEKAIQESKEIKTILFICALVAGLIILLLFFAVQRFRSKNQKLQYEQLKLREEKLLTEQQHLQLELDYKRKDIAAQMLFLLKKDELIHKISERIGSVKDEVPSEVQPKLQRITKELHGISKRNDGSWQEFELRFKEVHQDFYAHLEAQFPELTPKERRLCALLKLNMTTKEISSITHQSTRSLEVARTRLRKKLNLTNSEIGLVDFLSKY
ncbi:hypothetical protein DQQ10_10115 [Pseudochryseolinea flava]|uniref:HTH luxR-type domain-containing protein n=1 Tax=Pseudochryseolinea flava TaxID=2059302 RepID=A0A364Y5Z9_9BACT|nr:hypothetical protein DQQ10_10115 [Pseudochryseolinea flava]